MPDGNLARTPRLDPERELAAFEALKRALADECAGDPDFILDLAEGQTNLLETIDAMLAADLLDDGLLDGVKAAQDALAFRADRFSSRKARRRALIEQAMFILEQKKLERPSATISLATRKPKLEVVDESKVPSDFFKTNVVLDKKKLNDAFATLTASHDAELAAAKAEGRDPAPFAMIDGCAVGNGSASITIRRR